MKKLSANAQRSLNRYLHAVRARLPASSTVDREEVERDLLAHIERELAGTSEPVGWTRLQPILDRLGSPSLWVPEEELSVWQRFHLHLRVGPEDWRLSYLSLAMFLAAAGLATLGFWPGAVLCMLTSFLTARAVTSCMADLGEAPGPQSWLIGPVLVTCYATLALAIVLLPLALLFVGAVEVLRLEQLKPRFPAVGVQICRRIAAVLTQPSDGGLTALALLKTGPWLALPMACWWGFLAFLSRWNSRVLSFLLDPFAPPRSRWVFVCLALLCSVTIAAAALVVLAKHVSFTGFRV